MSTKEKIAKATVTRYGAYGDAIMITPVFRHLKEDGYYVRANINARSEEVLRHNPNIDEFLVHDESIKIEDLDAHWGIINKGYDKVINLTGSIEGGLLAVQWKPDFDLPKEERHKRFNVNYYDRTMEIAGYPVKGVKGELHFTRMEREIAYKSIQKHRKGDRFVILWGLSGSSFHKVHPETGQIQIAFANAHPDVVFINVGDDVCRLLEVDGHPRIVNRSGAIGIRRTLAMIPYVDMVVSPETAVLNAAGCYPVHKVALLSHSSEENLTKHFDNCISLHADVECYPCHRLIYTKDACPLDPKTDSPVCMSQLSAAKILNSMEDIYGISRRKGRQSLVC